MHPPLERPTLNKVTYYSSLWQAEILSLVRQCFFSLSLSLSFFMLKWHRDALLRWSQFCVIPAHMHTTPNHPSDGFKDTVRVAYTQPALRCVSILGGEMREVRGWEGLGVWWKLPSVTPGGGYDQNHNEHGSITYPTVFFLFFFSPNVRLRGAYPHMLWQTAGNSVRRKNNQQHFFEDLSKSWNKQMKLRGAVRGAERGLCADLRGAGFK